MGKSQKRPLDVQKANEGGAGPGKTFVPSAEEPAKEKAATSDAPDSVRSAPPPRVPISEEDYRTLKEAAQQRRNESDNVPSQEDVPEPPSR
jgi:hypothetical protein